MSQENYNFDTLSIHAGYEPDPQTGARNLPIYASTAFAFKDTDHAQKLFALDEIGFIYSRLTNPTTNALQTKVAALEKGVFSTAFSSGHAAETACMFALMDGGKEIVAGRQLYGGSINLFGNSFKKFGWKTVFADCTKPEKIKAAINENTRVIFIESIANPGGVFVDIEKIAKIANEAGVVLVVDNTLATPYLIKPFDYGAHVVIHSMTKFMVGNGTALGGIVVDSGTFDFTNNDKYPNLSQPSPDYHGTVFAEKFGNLSLSLYLHAVGLRDLGACLSPFNAWLINNGLETLSLRMERHSSNALAVAKYLKQHPKVVWVSYPGLPDDEYHNLQQKYSPKGAGSVFSFGISGGDESGIKLVNSVKLFSHVANLGDIRSLIIHPSTTTHSQLSSQQKEESGAAPDTLRVSIGLEDIEDIISDLDQALSQI